MNDDREPDLGPDFDPDYDAEPPEPLDERAVRTLISRHEREYEVIVARQRITHLEAHIEAQLVTIQQLGRDLRKEQAARGGINVQALTQTVAAANELNSRLEAEIRERDKTIESLRTEIRTMQEEAQTG